MESLCCPCDALPDLHNSVSHSVDGNERLDNGKSALTCWNGLQSLRGHQLPRRETISLEENKTTEEPFPIIGLNSFLAKAEF